MYENIRFLSTHLKVLGIIFALSIPGAWLATGCILAGYAIYYNLLQRTIFTLTGIDGAISTSLVMFCASIGCLLISFTLNWLISDVKTSDDKND